MILFFVQILYESFDEPFDGRWIVSEKAEYQGKALVFLLICLLDFLVFVESKVD